MKKVLILGATGTFGKELTKKLLKETEYHLTVFSRHCKEIYESNNRITAINGDATNINELEIAIKEQDIVYCAISGEKLPIVAENLVELMNKYNMKRIIFMGAVGIYNEIPEEIDGKDNVNNNPEQIPNRDAVEIIEKSSLDYTILRLGYLRSGEESDYIITEKGELAKGYITTIPSILKLACKLIDDDNLYVGKSICITKNME